MRDLPRTRDFSPIELTEVSAFKIGELKIAPRADILTAGRRSNHLYTVLEGVAFRYVLLPDGRRQILNFLFPGDFIGLQAVVLDDSEHSVTSLTAVTLCVFEKRRLTRLFRNTPELGYDVTWLSAQEQSFVDLNLVAVGRFRADERIAYLLLSVFSRMREAGMAETDSCPFPLTQAHLADALGLSQPYANHAIRRLREDGLVEFADGRLNVLDWAGLRERAISEPTARDDRPFI